MVHVSFFEFLLQFSLILIDKNNFLKFFFKIFLLLILITGIQFCIASGVKLSFTAGCVINFISGKCISESECRSLCPSKPNMLFAECGNLPCEKTCQDNLQNLCRISNDHVSNSLCRAGCYCQDGYVKDLKSQMCVLRQDCPGDCEDPNQQFR